MESFFITATFLQPKYQRNFCTIGIRILRGLLFEYKARKAILSLTNVTATSMSRSDSSLILRSEETL